jgi:hypothetical protein
MIIKSNLINLAKFHSQSPKNKYQMHTFVLFSIKSQFHFLSPNSLYQTHIVLLVDVSISEYQNTVIFHCAFLNLMFWCEIKSTLNIAKYHTDSIGLTQCNKTYIGLCHCLVDYSTDEFYWRSTKLSNLYLMRR